MSADGNARAHYKRICDAPLRFHYTVKEDYYYEKKIIIHRVYKIIKTDDEYFIYTKGDANNNYDNYKITNDMIVGIVKFKIPLVGYPTVLLNERW